MSATELLALAERVESATGPDRELDCLIWCATAESHFEYHGGECVLAVQGGFAARLDWAEIPHPTASIDAAMMLVPEGWHGFVELGYSRPHMASLEQSMPEGPTCVAATPALALTAAALRAIAAKEPS